MPRPDSILSRITDHTKVVLLQYTYGRFDPSERQKLLDGLKSRDISVIEDCCHMIRTDDLFRGNENPDAVFFSTQWNKPFSTGLGGMAVFKDFNLYKSAKNIRSALKKFDIHCRPTSLLQK